MGEKEEEKRGVTLRKPMTQFGRIFSNMCLIGWVLGKGG